MRTLRVLLAAPVLVACGQAASAPAPSVGPAVPPVPPAPAPAGLPIGPLDRTGLPALSDAGVLALRILEAATEFKTNRRGKTRAVEPEAEAMRVLWREKEADAAFKTLLRPGATVPTLYGLCGLWYTDPAAFPEVVAGFLKERGRELVMTRDGCEGRELRVAEVLDASTAGRTAARLRDRSQSLREWREAAGTRCYDLDVIGGGWASSLRRGDGGE
jgi:hypothetical protein